MRPHILTSAIASFLLLAGGSSASAQQIDVGGTISDFYVAYGNGNFVGAGPLATIHLTGKHAVQVVTDLRYQHWERSRSVTGIYSLQYRYTFQEPSSRTRLFVTAGTVGGVSWLRVSGYSYIDTGHYEDGKWVAAGPTGVGFETLTRFRMTPPWVPVLGAGIERNVTRRLAIRADAASAMGPYGAVGIRVSAGAVLQLRKTGSGVISK